MTKQEILAHIDHTILKPYAKWEDIVKLCDEAILYQMASVCVPPCYVKRIHDTYADEVNICTVVGFPLGYSTKETKVEETKQAIVDGCNEIDVVINITDVKNGNFDKIADELAAVRNACCQNTLKVIIETCYLTQEEKIRMCQIVTDCGANFIKTSTGFGTAGAQMEDIILFKKYIGPNVRIKAAGGIRSEEEMVAFLTNGCDRIGTSAAKLLFE